MIKKLNTALVILCILLTLSACGDKTPAPPDTSGGTSEELTSAAMSETTSAEASEEPRESSAPEETSSTTGAAASSQAASSTKAAGTTSKPNSTAPPPSTNSSKPADPPTVTPDPPAKSIYDRPYDIAEIEKDMEKYIVGKGGNYRWDLNLDNCGHWVDPLPTSSKWYGDKLKNTLLEDIDERMSRGLYSKFRVYFKPISGGEYEIIVLCG